MTAIPLGTGGEFDRIREISRALGEDAGPLGDDTAAVPGGDGTLVVSIDTSVEDIHFRRAWLSPQEIGYRAAAAALSDLAAAAAVPAGVVAAITVPRDTPHGFLASLMRGVGDAARVVNTGVLGGDLSAGATLSVAITVLGYARLPMSRAGARVGDGVWVTGKLGGARAALESWIAGIEPVAEARAAFAHPNPRLAAAEWLAAQGATAMMDLSDGLAGDAEHLAAASGVELAIALELLPVHAAVSAVALRLDESAAAFAARGGEDYELLVTLPAEFSHAAECEATTGTSLKRIGRVTEGSGVMFSNSGTTIALTGYRHHL